MSDDPTRYEPPVDDSDMNWPADEGPDAGEPPVDSVEEEWYDSPEAFVTDDEIAEDEESSGALFGGPIWWVVGAILVIIIALLLFRACNSSGGAPDPAATVEPAATAETRPTFTPTPLSGDATVAPAEEAEPPATPVPSTPIPSALQTGMNVQVGNTDGEGVRFRTGPGTNYVTIDILEDAAALKIVGGPEEADDFIWWRVQTVDGAVGWIVEDFLAPAGE